MILFLFQTEQQVQEHYVHAMVHTEQAVEMRAASGVVCFELRMH